VVKLFLRKPETSQGLVQKVLETATKDCDSPDVRDRAYIYWRLLSTDPGAAKVSVHDGNVDPCAKVSVGCDFGSSATNIDSENERFSGASRRAHQRDLKFGQRIPQACWHFHRAWAYWCRLHAKAGRVRAHTLKAIEI
jgi:hypothetical protein